jgi:hypothetical protein
MNKIKQTLTALIRAPVFHLSLAMVNYSTLSYRLLTDTVTPWHILTLIAAAGTTLTALWLIEQRYEERLQEVRESILDLMAKESRAGLQRTINIHDVLTDVITIQGRLIDKLEERY